MTHALMIHKIHKTRGIHRIHTLFVLQTAVQNTNHAVDRSSSTLARKQPARVSIFAAQALKARHGSEGYRRVAEENRNCEINLPDQRVVIGSEVHRQRGFQRQRPTQDGIARAKA